MLTGWFSIAPERPFLDDLARGLLDQMPGPGELAEAVVLAPTRRAGRDLAAAFLGAAGGRALLLPQIRALGDLDEGEAPFEPGDITLDLPPAIGARRRRFELAGLAREASAALGRELGPIGALEMADALAAFLDGLKIEGVDPLGKLDGLADADLAEHWRRSSDLLELVLQAWPKRLAALGVIDLAERRVRLLDLLAERWGRAPPDRPLIAAGSTGAQPATARLLTAIAAAPRGAVVLPGLDKDMADTVWAQVEDQHPQAALRRLLGLAGVARAAVADWPGPVEMRGRWRRRVVSEALRPAEATADWLDVIKGLRKEADADPIAAGLEGLSLIEAAQEQEAAQVCALLLRETLEAPGATGALITPDLDLARRVSAELARWGVVADSSAGQPVSRFPPAVLAQQLLLLLADPADPVALLAALKHPLCALGTPQARSDLERHGLRGPRPRDLDHLAQRLAETERLSPERRAGAQALARDLAAALAPLSAPFAGGAAPVVAAARGLAEAMEALAGPQAWSGAGGECLSAMIAALIEEADALASCSPVAFAALAQRLIEGESVRAQGAGHPRLRILGVLEGRLIRADRVILAGLEEGVWPRPAPGDPFLSRPMRQALGLGSPERRLGLSAHDFAQAACAPNVTLVTAKRRGGAPAVESRWLWRLRTLVKGAGHDLPRRPDILAWARALQLAAPPDPAPRPRPAPPLAARPRELPVTAIETWLRDPYAVYARYVLGLRPLDPPDLAIGPRQRGTAIHAALERFAKDHGGALPGEAERLLALVLEEELGKAGMPLARMVRERALIARLTLWLVDFDAGRRQDAEILVEQQGAIDFLVAGESFRLTARADRLERRGGVVDILDFKTGRVPSLKEVESLIASQLSLTAAIIAAGGFAELGRREPGELTYVRVVGRRTVGEVEVRAGAPSSGELGQAALGRLRARIAAYMSPDTAYLSRVMPHKANEEGDYDHLARVKEWSAGGEGAEGGE